MKRISFVFILLITAVIFLFISCESKEETVLTKVNFSFENKLITNSSNFMRVTSKEKMDAKFLVITIENGAGEKVYDTKKIELYTFNESYISEPVSLNFVENEYKLTQFLVLDANNDVIYFTPNEKSSSANFVNNPLPISFKVDKNQITKIIPEVISSESAVEADYGYSTFEFNIIHTINMKMAVRITDSVTNNETLTDAEISISSNDTIIHYYDSINEATKKIRFRDGYENYSIIASKKGYDTQRVDLTRAEINKFAENPLTIYLPQKKNPISTMAIIVTKTGTNMIYQFKSGTDYVTDLKINSVRIFDTQNNLKMTIKQGIGEKFSISYLPEGYYILQVDVANSAIFSKIFYR